MHRSWLRSVGGLVTSVALAVPMLAAVAAPAAAAGPADLRINEVESNGGSPDDWVEIVNLGADPVDLSGYVVKDNDDSHVFTIPAGTTIAAGGYYAADVAVAFGLGAADSARLYTPGTATLVDSYTWTAHAATTYGRCPNGTGAFTTTTSSTKGAANACGAVVPSTTVNEVESSGGSPDDWVELVNTGTTTADVSGFVLKDDDDTHAFTIPAGTTIAAGGYYAADVATAFGLGSADSARLFTPGAATLVDSYTWTAHAATTYGRCPNGTGPFTTTTTSTKGAANACPGDIVALPWPGGSAAAVADDANVFGTNLSGLAYQPSGTSAPGVLWAVKNGPGTLYRLVFDGTRWTPDTANGWANGKVLHYPDGTGDPDAEGVTLVGDDPANGVYVSTERNNAASTVSRPAVLRFDVGGSATALTATDDWNLTADLPVLGANLGLEAVVHVPDAVLVAKGFVDQRTGVAYDPAAYPGHGSGLFLVGAEQNGAIYAYALGAGGTSTKVATIASGFPSVMDLELEPESGLLWAECDDTCGGRTATLDVASSGADVGRFVPTAFYERPSGLPNLNDEGFAIAPRAECVDGHKPVLWSDDTNDDGHALRSGTIRCTPRSAQTITFAAPSDTTVGAAPQRLVATASSGLPVVLSATGPCAVTGPPAAPTLTATGAGSCVVTAGQAGDANTAPAPQVARTVTISKAGTTLVQRPVSLLGSVLGLRVRFAAVLTDSVTGQPVPGQLVTFRATPSGATCTGTTDASGLATCGSGILAVLATLLHGSTTASYAGGGDFLGTTTTTPWTLA